MLAGLLAGMLLVAGCGKEKPSTEMPDSAAGGEAAVAEDGSDHMREGDPSRYELELEAYEDAMLSAGVELPSLVARARADRGQETVPASDGGGVTAGARCERICGLATNICQLKDRICGLANEHPDERRYAQICERATLDCERATTACEGCDE